MRREAFIAAVCKALDDYDHREIADGALPARWLEPRLQRAYMKAMLIEDIQVELRKLHIVGSERDMIASFLAKRRAAGQFSFSIRSYYRLKDAWFRSGRKLESLADGRPVWRSSRGAKAGV